MEHYNLDLIYRCNRFVNFNLPFSDTFVFKKVYRHLINQFFFHFPNVLDDYCILDEWILSLDHEKYIKYCKDSNIMSFHFDSLDFNHIYLNFLIEVAKYKRIFSIKELFIEFVTNTINSIVNNYDTDRLMNILTILLEQWESKLKYIKNHDDLSTNTAKLPS